MCGIAGYVGSGVIEDRRVEACLRRMRRRGPDHADAVQRRLADGRICVLAHSRLSILDLDSRSNQPMVRGALTTVFNGELYNYVELRELLESRGYVFETMGDTEVLLAMLQDRGLLGLDQMEGMWAFALLDEEKSSVLLCRDRFGEKPLYYLEEPGGIYFGSEIKFIDALRGGLPPVDRRQVLRLLVNGYKSLGKRHDTFFENIRELPASSWAMLDSGPVRPHKYWSVCYRPDNGMSAVEAADGVKKYLRRSVDMRLRADVPIAFCLSGGVDSNSLAACASRWLGRKVHGFTLVNQDARYDEIDEVESSVAELGIAHTKVPLPVGNLREQLTVLIAHHDAPLYTVTSYVQWHLLEAVRRQGFKVSVSGVGADELLTGYFDHHNMYLAEMTGTAAHSAALNAWNSHIRPVVRNRFLQDPHAFSLSRTLRDHIYLDRELFLSWMIPDFDEEFTETEYDASLLRNRMLNELLHESVPAIIHEDDANAMFHSIENRAPFLDRALCEFCFQIPTKHLIRDGYSKSPLRDAMRGVVPERILSNRKKVGFNAPVGDLLEGPSDVDWILADGPIFDLVSREKIRPLLGRQAHPNSESKFLFSVMCAKIFLELYAT